MRLQISCTDAPRTELKTTYLLVGLYTRFLCDTCIYVCIYSIYWGKEAGKSGNRGDQVVIGVGVVSDWLRE